MHEMAPVINEDQAVIGSHQIGLMRDHDVVIRIGLGYLVGVDVHLLPAQREPGLPMEFGLANRGEDSFHHRPEFARGRSAA